MTLNTLDKLSRGRLDPNSPDQSEGMVTYVRKNQQTGSQSTRQFPASEHDRVTAEGWRRLDEVTGNAADGDPHTAPTDLAPGTATDIRATNAHVTPTNPVPLAGTPARDEK